jgi:hypothetical protein
MSFLFDFGTVKCVLDRKTSDWGIVIEPLQAAVSVHVPSFVKTV